jgi:hypothetical protein
MLRIKLLLLPLLSPDSLRQARTRLTSPTGFSLPRARLRPRLKPAKARQAGRPRPRPKTEHILQPGSSRGSSKRAWYRQSRTSDASDNLIEQGKIGAA